MMSGRPKVGISNCVAVVQLEERFPAKEEVIGSNPIGYTIFLLLIGFSDSYCHSGNIPLSVIHHDRI